jgi:hypothetical protein
MAAPVLRPAAAALIGHLENGHLADYDRDPAIQGERLHVRATGNDGGSGDELALDNREDLRFTGQPTHDARAAGQDGFVRA